VREGEQRCAAEMLRAADAAMYRAKTTGGATCHSSDVADVVALRPKSLRRFGHSARN
jgi:GGDEF domain-containing protein